MSILLKTMDKMLSVMDKGVQQDVSRQLFEKFGGSLVIEPAKKTGGKRKSKVPYWIREVTEVDLSQKGFAALVGAWCTASKVGTNGSIYLAGIRGDWYKGGEKYAVVRQGSGIQLGGFTIDGLATDPDARFVNFKELVSCLE